MKDEGSRSAIISRSRSPVASSHSEQRGKAFTRFANACQFSCGHRNSETRSFVVPRPRGLAVSRSRGLKVDATESNCKIDRNCFGRGLSRCSLPEIDLVNAILSNGIGDDRKGRVAPGCVCGQLPLCRYVSRV